LLTCLPFQSLPKLQHFVKAARGCGVCACASVCLCSSDYVLS
jgi:hypothetical protein